MKNEKGKRIGAWLWFFMLSFVIITFWIIFLEFLSLWGTFKVIVHWPAGLLLMELLWPAGITLMEFIYTVGFAAYVVYALNALLKHKPNAISLAIKTNIVTIIFFISQGIRYFVLMGKDTDVWNATVFTTVFCIISLAYFYFSNGLKEAYPMAQRKSLIVDNLLFAAIILMIILVNVVFYL